MGTHEISIFPNAAVFWHHAVEKQKIPAMPAAFPMRRDTSRDSRRPCPVLRIFLPIGERCPDPRSRHLPPQRPACIFYFLQFRTLLPAQALRLLLMRPNHNNIRMLPAVYLPSAKPWDLYRICCVTARTAMDRTRAGIQNPCPCYLTFPLCTFFPLYPSLVHPDYLIPAKPLRIIQHTVRHL